LTKPPAHLTAADCATLQRHWGQDLGLVVGPGTGLVTFRRLGEQILAIRHDAESSLPSAITAGPEQPSPGETAPYRNLIRRQLAGQSYPDRDTAWEFGQAIYNCGFKIFSGLRAFYVAGLLADFYGVLGRFFLRKTEDSANPYIELLPLWKIIACVDAATQWHGSYAEPLVAKLYAEGRLARLGFKSKAYGLASRADYNPNSSLFDDFSLGFRARKLLRFTQAINRSFQRAWKGWRRFGTPAHPASPMRSAMNAAIILARERNIPYRERVFRTRSLLLGELRTCLPHELVDETERFRDLLPPPNWPSHVKPLPQIDVIPTLFEDDAEEW